MPALMQHFIKKFQNGTFIKEKNLYKTNTKLKWSKISCQVACTFALISMRWNALLLLPWFLPLHIIHNLKLWYDIFDIYCAAYSAQCRAGNSYKSSVVQHIVAKNLKAMLVKSIGYLHPNKLRCNVCHIWEHYGTRGRKVVTEITNYSLFVDILYETISIVITHK